MQTIRCEGAKRSVRETRFLIVQRLPMAPDPPIQTQAELMLSDV